MEAPKLPEWIRRDFFYISLLLLALFACLYTINQSLTIQKECIDTCRLEWCYNKTTNRGYNSWETPNLTIININSSSGMLPKELVTITHYETDDTSP